MRRDLHLARVLAPLALLATTAAGCGGSSDDDPLASYRAQVLDWQPCDPTIVSGEPADFLAKLGDRARCTRMRAPIDYAHPTHGDLSVAIMRVAAGSATERMGAILLNPGGPGGDGLILAPIFGWLWANASTSDPVAAPYRRMSEVYDVVGFSPRGTGASTRLYCGSNESQPFVANYSADRSPANVAAQLTQGQMIAAACARNPLTPFINTDTTVRDMDLMRHLLGDQKLNFFGASYGTWLGVWYASVFPERVGRMMLSGMANLATGLEETFLTMPIASQYVLDQVIAPYATRHPEVYGLGTDAEAVRQIHRTLPPDLQAAVSQALDVRSSSGAWKDALTLRVAEQLKRIVEANPGATEYAMQGIIAEARFLPVDDAGLEARAHEIALRVNTGYFEQLRRETGPVDLAGGAALAYAVVCNDEAPGRSLSDWVEANDREAALYPFGGGSWTGFPCFWWGGPTVKRPPIEGAQRAGGILITQTQRDPVTALEGALASFGMLPNASLVQVDGDDYNHGVAVPYGTACVDGPIADFFLHGTQPVRETHCPGKALAPPPLTPVASALRTMPVASPAEGSEDTMFLDAMEARRAREAISRILADGPRTR